MIAPRTTPVRSHPPTIILQDRDEGVTQGPGDRQKSPGWGLGSCGLPPRETELRLRPVFHHTDPKVRAHISLCMLALLLERSLEQRMRQAGAPMTAPACREELSTCYLNVLEASPSTEPAYTLTTPTAEQRALLKRLGLQGLLDKDDLVERIRPRSSK
jgi:hypothetical protein